jgi:peptidoglycan/LPS O-acetylase OafA/YrhL
MKWIPWRQKTHQTDSSKINNFSSLRLLFASAVIFSHSSSILTGDTSLEPNIVGIKLGELAVDGFFIVSGYLIAKSFDLDGNLVDFFRKRVLRIYPAFLVNAMLCLFVIAPLVTRDYRPSLLWAPHLLFLGSPNVSGAFAGMPMEALNGSAWTLAYEFRCYTLVAAIGIAFGLRRVRIVILGVAITLLILRGLPTSSGAIYVALGSPPDIAHLFGMFAAGMSFYLWREKIAYDHWIAAAAAVALGVGLFSPYVANLSIAIFGSYIIFWSAFKLPTMILSRFGNKTDLSFGIYLYAWPIQMIVAYSLHRAINPFVLSCVALVAASGAAWISWTFVERPAMALSKSRREFKIMAAAK